MSVSRPPFAAVTTTIAALCVMAPTPASAQCEAQRLLPADAQYNDSFGQAVALSGDYAIVGAPFKGEAPNPYGAAYIFRVDRNSWVEHAKLTNGDPERLEGFGLAVAIDCDTVFVGAPYRRMGDVSGAGIVCVFERVGESWTRRATLTSPDPQHQEFFGTAIAISGDYAVVGNKRHDTVGDNSGAVFVYRRTAHGWQYDGMIMPSDPSPYDSFGNAVAMKDDYLIVGAPGVASAEGAAFIFRRIDGVYQQEAELRTFFPIDRSFMGWSVALDGTRAVLGAPENPSAPPDEVGPGSIYVFVKIGDVWVLEAQLATNDGGNGDRFGWSVSMKNNTILAGAYLNDNGDGQLGSAYLFDFDGEHWHQRMELIPGTDPPAMLYGLSLGMGPTYSGDMWAIVGAHRTDAVASSSGAAHAWLMDCGGAGPPEDCTTDSDDDGYLDDCDLCPFESPNDADGDGVCYPEDECPMNPWKTAPGECGCVRLDTDSDNDGVADCKDACPGEPDIDSDSDGTLDCNDLCPQDPHKSSPGICGCGRADVDVDGDGFIDCPSTIPTAGGWGVVILILLLLTCAKACFGRIRPDVA